MKNGIFHDWLQDEPRYRSTLQGVIDINVPGESVAGNDALHFQIAGNVLNLTGKRDFLHAAAQRAAQQLTEQPDGIYDLFLFPQPCHGTDGFQRIVEKMRVHLGKQRAVFRFVKQRVGQNHLLSVLLQLMIHGFKLLTEIRCLIMRVWFDLLRYFLIVDAFEIFRKGGNVPQEALCDPVDDKNDHNAKQHLRQKKHMHQGIQVAKCNGTGNIADHRPVSAISPDRG